MSNGARLTIEFVEDGQVAQLTVRAGEPLSAEGFDRALLEFGITFGVDPSLRAELVAHLEDPAYESGPQVIARARPEVAGKDGYFEAAFHVGLQSGHARDDGSLDYHDREMLKPTTAGTVLGVLHEAVTGVPGMLIDGRSIPTAKTHPSPLQVLGGVERDADGTLRASRDGVVLYKAGQSISVVDKLVHQGPVDIHSGNLNMQGSLVIHGDVIRPFSVTTTGDLEIFGSISASTVSAGGHLRVHGGIRGADGCQVSAEGDLAAKHCESATVRAGRNLLIQESINSQLHATTVCVKGRVRGGSVVAEACIEVAEAGATSGTLTHLHAGEPLVSPVKEAQRQIAQARKQRLSERVRGVRDDRGKGGKAGRANAALAEDEIERIAERAARREQLSRLAHIDVEVAHAGVTVQISESRLTLNARVSSTRFRLDPETRGLKEEKIDR